MSSYIPRSLLDQIPDNSDPTYRMSMLPFATYADPQGGGEHLGFAMPGMIKEPINALSRLHDNFRFDDGHLGIPNPQNLDNQHDVASLLLDTFGGNATRGAGAVESAAARDLLSHPVESAPPAASVAAWNGTDYPAWMDRQMQRSVSNAADSDWYHAAHPDFQQFEDPTDYLGVHVTREKGIANDFQADRGGPLLRLGAPFEKPFTLPPYDHPAYPQALKEAQDLLPGFDGTKDSLERNAAAYRDILRGKGYDAIMSQDERLLDDPMEAIALNPKGLNSAIYSDTGKPSLFGSLLSSLTGGRGAWAGEGALAQVLSDTGNPSLPGMVVAGAEGNAPLRGYRGARNEANIVNENGPVWGSSRPDVANSYADAPAYDTTRTPAIAPMDFHFQNPMEIDAGGNLWHSLPQSLAPDAKSDPFRFPDRFRPDLLTTDDLADLAKAKGHDGLVVRNVLDSLFADNAMPLSQPAGTSDIYAALQRGTVKSPLTGETLFSDGMPSLWGAALGGQDRRGF